MFELISFTAPPQDQGPSAAYFTGCMIFISGVLATIGWLHTVRANFKMSRRSRTFDYINELYRDKHLKNTLREVRHYLNSNNVSPRKNAEQADMVDKYSDLLDVYEHFSAAILTGDIDEQLALRSMRTRILRFRQVFWLYINDVRKESRASPGVRTGSAYKNLQHLAARWRNPKKSRPEWGHVVIEFVKMTPLTKVEYKSLKNGVYFWVYPINWLQFVWKQCTSCFNWINGLWPLKKN